MAVDDVEMGKTGGENHLRVETGAMKRSELVDLTVSLRDRWWPPRPVAGAAGG